MQTTGFAKWAVISELNEYVVMSVWCITQFRGLKMALAAAVPKKPSHAPLFGQNSPLLCHVYPHCVDVSNYHFLSDSQTLLEDKMHEKHNLFKNPPSPPCGHLELPHKNTFYAFTYESYRRVSTYSLRDSLLIDQRCFAKNLRHCSPPIPLLLTPTAPSFDIPISIDLC